MSDHSTGSSGSSTNSWTILSPEEAAVETVGPDDGTESLCGVPGLPEEGTGVHLDSDVSGPDTPVEAVLSEEGQQVCQETSPEVCEGAAFAGPSFSGFEEGEFDPDIHAPVIHDTITSSPPDSDLLGSTPFAISSEAAMLFSEEPAFAPPASDMFTDVGYGREISAEDLLFQESCTPEVLSKETSPVPEVTPEVTPELRHSPEPLSQHSPAPEGLPEESPAAHEAVTAEAPILESRAPESSAPEVPPESAPVASASSTAPAPEVLLTRESPVTEPQTERSPTPEAVPAEVTHDLSSSAPEAPRPAPAPAPVETLAPEGVEDLSLSMQGHPVSSFTPTPEASPAEGGLGPVGMEPETISSISAQPQEEEEEEYGEEPALEEDADVIEQQNVEPVEAVPIEEVVRAEPGAEGDGLRQRHASPPEPAPALGRSSEDEEEEEEEFQLAERREEKHGFALNKLIVGALVLLCLGSLFLSDDGYDGSEMTEQELLERLAQENQQIAMLESQLQSQKEALNQALRAAAQPGEEGGGALQKENVKMKEELAAMPGLREELESLRARVAELSQLTVRESETEPTDTVTPPADQLETTNQIPAVPEQMEGAEQEEGGEDGLKAELQRQKSLLEDSRKRLEGMKRSVGKKKGVREGLVEMQKRLSEQAERLDKRHDWKRKQQQRTEADAKKDQNRKWMGKKEQGNQWGAKKERDEKREDKSDKHKSQWESKKNGRKEDGGKWEGKKDHGKPKHHEESEKWRGGEKERKNGKNGKDGGKTESKQDAWRKYHEDWDGRKHERRVEREKRKSERPWEAKKDSGHNHHHHQGAHSHEKPSEHKHEHKHKHESVDFWKHQEQKLRRNPGPGRACSGAAACAEAEGLVAVELAEFQALLESYLSKLPPPSSTGESKEALLELTTGFFSPGDGVFDHERLLFSDFAEDVADILEDLADVLDDSLEEEMEEFEREALWKFAATAA
ncbi:pre-B-cell leukemia transcription factor-interacting protein 1 [Sardina pilchardus]|uniref:pre-B-cell leukemia transcription factor-interacting protein 1 n=1 Tax=Sardina pilchardus TaxID=27697 RepID=UPI002E10738E